MPYDAGCIYMRLGFDFRMIRYIAEFYLKSDLKVKTELFPPAKSFPRFGLRSCIIKRKSRENAAFCILFFPKDLILFIVIDKYLILVS